MVEFGKMKFYLGTYFEAWIKFPFLLTSSIYIEEDNPEALERLAQYIVHSSFSSEKIKFIEKTGCVMYKSKMHLGKKRNFEILDAIEFLHRRCLHIPDPYESLIRYYGYYSNAARGKRKKLGLDPADDIEIDIIDDSPSKKACRKTWAQLIYKIYEVDPLLCPKCGSRMKIIAFIQDYDIQHFRSTSTDTIRWKITCRQT